MATFPPDTPLAPVGPNPNPARITTEIWDFWAAFKALEKSAQLGGIYANKPGYHNTRAANKTGDYSVRDPQDQLGPDDKAAAIDLTFPDAQAKPPRYDTIDLYSSRLLASGKDKADPRGDYLREFYGQADTDREVEGWDFRYLRPVTSDESHLWHIHISISREHVANPAAMRALLSILRGETVEQWRAAEAGQSTEEDDMGVRLIAPTEGWGKGAVYRLYPTGYGMALELLERALDDAVKVWGGEVYVKDALALGTPLEELIARRSVEVTVTPGPMRLTGSIEPATKG